MTKSQHFGSLEVYWLGPVVSASVLFPVKRASVNSLSAGSMSSLNLPHGEVPRGGNWTSVSTETSQIINPLRHSGNSLSSLTLFISCTWHSPPQRRHSAHVADLWDLQSSGKMLIKWSWWRCCWSCWYPTMARKSGMDGGCGAVWGSLAWGWLLDELP